MKPQILQLNLSELSRDDTNTKKLLCFLESEWPQHPWRCVLETTTLVPGMESLLLNRAGNNSFPLRSDKIDCLNIAPPAYNNAFTKTFAEITDEQCCTWLQEKNDRPWLIYWSGGIDSTVIVSSILKNTTSADRENMYIVCNRASIYELPRFFYNHVQPNFKLLSSPRLGTDLFEKYHVITGDFGDQLYGGGGLWEMMHSEPDRLILDLRRDPDRLLDFMSQKINRKFAVWYYECMLENINSTNIPVETYHDFWWWQFFNYSQSSIYLSCIKTHGFDQTNCSKYQYPDWFATDDYQQWSMNNNQCGIKYNLNLIDCKLPSKNYIYDFDRDLHSRTFKTKQTSRQNKSQEAGQICLLDDFSLLNLDRDLDRIMELLPNHVVN